MHKNFDDYFDPGRGKKVESSNARSLKRLKRWWARQP